LSNKYKIFETVEFQKQFSKIPLKNREFLTRKLKNYVYPQLTEEPFFGKNIKKLVHFTPNIWRYRIGNYRLFYTVNSTEKVIYLLTLDLRKDIYKK